MMTHADKENFMKKYMTENGTTDQGTVISQNGKIKLILQIPESLQNQNSKKDRTYFILCSKNGNVEALNGTYDAKAKTITFEAEDYADYALVYQETDKPDNGGGNDQEPETDDNTKKDDNKQNGNKDNNKNNNNKNNNKNNNNNNQNNPQNNNGNGSQKTPPLFQNMKEWQDKRCRKVRVVINSIKKIFLIIKWFFVWVYRKIKQFCKRVWRRQDLLLCIATLIMVGYATFWRYDNKSFDGKEVWWGISVIIGLIVALVIGTVGSRNRSNLFSECRAI